jgi:FixJ family two-component response regulator
MVRPVLPSICIFVRRALEETGVPKVPMISIIDDDVSMRDATRRLVKSLGLNANTFASAEEFLESDRLNDTACVITDMQMPGLSGADLQSLLIAQGVDTPIIFITAFPEEKLRRRVLNAGAVGFLSKPFDEGHLIRCLKTALGSEAGASFEHP